MKKKNILSILTLAIFALNISPALSITIDKPPIISSINKKQRSTVNPLYPAKYTPAYIEGIKSNYRKISKDEVIYVALDMLKNTNGEFSRKAILGNNLTSRPIRVEFKNLKEINEKYSSYNALGWKKGKNLYIYISHKHKTSPAIALAALLSHEALHQDEYNSLAEETYAWTMEAAVWCELLELYPNYEIGMDSLVHRENTLKKLFEKGNYSSKYIRKTVYTNEGYQSLPESSPGFEAL